MPRTWASWWVTDCEAFRALWRRSWAFCLPGGALMYVVGMTYQQHGERALVAAMLKGVAAAAVGLILATAVQLGKRSLPHGYDLIFTGATVIGVNRLHFSVLTVLICVGLVAILWYSPGRLRKEGLANHE